RASAPVTAQVATLPHAPTIQTPTLRSMVSRSDGPNPNSRPRPALDYLLYVLEEQIAGHQDVTRHEHRVPFEPPGVLILPHLRFLDRLQELLRHLRRPVVLLRVERLERILAVRLEGARHHEIVMIQPPEVVALVGVESKSGVKLDRVV